MDSSKKRKLDQVTTGTAVADPEKEQIARLLEPFTREQLVEILSSVASQYKNVYEEIRTVASADLAHRKVFVRGLAWETNSETLKEAFQVFGQVEEAAVIFEKATKKSRGFGFVTFVDMDAAQRATEKKTIEIDGRKATCNLAALKPQVDEQPAAQRNSMAAQNAAASTVYTTALTGGMFPVVSSVAQPMAMAPSNQHGGHGGHGGAGDEAERKLFVRGLSWDTTSEMLHAEFQKYGEIEEATVARDRKTNKSKGFGFVTYRHKSSADRALQQPQKIIDGRKTSCNLACQGGNKQQHMDPRVMVSPSPMAPMMSSYSLPVQQMGMYAAPAYAAGPNPPLPQQPLSYGGYPASDPYRQPSAAYGAVPPHPYYSQQVASQPPPSQSSKPSQG